MVPVASRCLIYILVACGYVFDSRADTVSDIFKSIRNAANEVESVAIDAWQGAESAGSKIADRFKDTKATRSLDYALRKAAFETALKTAQTGLDLAEKTVDVTLLTAEKTVQSAVSVGDAFLADLVQKTSSAVLEGSAVAAQGILEGAKQAGILTLQGSNAVITNVFGQFDINRLFYESSLKRLASGVLGNVACDAVVLGKDVSFSFDLDPRDLSTITHSLKPLFKEIERFFTENFALPTKNKHKRLQENSPLVDEAEHAVDASTPGVLMQAQLQEKVAVEAVAQLTSAETDLLRQLKEVSEKLKNVARQRNAELEGLVKKQGATGVAARQELVRRKRS